MTWALGLAHSVLLKVPRRHPNHWPACYTGLHNRRRFFVPSGCSRSWQAAYSLLLGHAPPWDHRAWLPPFCLQAGDLKLSVTGWPVTPTGDEDSTPPKDQVFLGLPLRTRRGTRQSKAR